MAAAWKAAWATFLAMLYMPSSYALVLHNNQSKTGITVHIDASTDDTPTDKSGNQFSFNGDQGGIPTSKTASINGHPAWDMNNQCFYTPSVQLNTEATIFIVSTVKNTITSWGCQFWHGDHDSDFGVEQMAYGTNQMNLQSYNDNTGCLIPYTIDEPVVWSGRTNSDARTFWKTTWVNGVASKETESATGSSNGRPSAGIKRVTIGGNGDRGCGEKFNGIIGELIYYNSALSDVEMQSVTDGLFAKWGLGAIQTSSQNQGEASGTGDPHLQNMRGERFDLLRSGKFLLINIPRGRPVEDALLAVEADAYRSGGHCEDIYFVALNITGAWADMAQTGGLRFDANTARDEKPKWAKLGPVELKVAHGRTDQGTRYLNFYVKHLGRAGYAVGGLLGEDDHSEAVVPSEGCRRTLTLALSREGKGKGPSLRGSVAEAV